MTQCMKKYLLLLPVLVLLFLALPIICWASESTPATLSEQNAPVILAPMLDEEGNLVLDENGEPIFIEQIVSAEDLAVTESEGAKTDPNAEDESVYPDELRVGSPTITKGDFFNEMFGNDTADIDVRALIHGYNLVNWDQNQGVYLIDESVVENVMVVTNELGDKTYFFGLYDDLYYSDGTQITAWDYAFSLLLMMSPEIEQIGGKIYRAEHILGYDEYITGEVPYLLGVGVIDDYQLAITLDHNFLPYFYETGLFLCVPYPISVIAPGCKVYAGGAYDLGNGYGYGIYIGNEDKTIEEPIYTAKLLEKTILDPETGYNSHPSVSSGPYVLTDYDYETAHFVINDYYKGAWVYNNLPAIFEFDVENHAGVGSGDQIHNKHDGPNIYVIYKDVKTTEEALEEARDTGEVHDAITSQRRAIYLVKPTIEKISFSVADNDTMAEDLLSGKFNLVNKVAYGPAIYECMGIPNNIVSYQNYPRIGLAFLTFTYEWPTVYEKEVRQAIAWCMDRDQMAQDYCGEFGERVDGYYGIEQWEYLICTRQLIYPINFINDETHTQKDLERLSKYPYSYVTNQEEYEKAKAAWDLLTLENLTDYKVNTEKANMILDDAGWTLNRSGGTYDPSVDDVRCKMIDGELIALDLTMMYPEGNHIVDTLQKNMIDNLNECGILLTLVPAPMEELLLSYYRETERTTDMIYLATNFHVIVDPSITYSTDDTAHHEIWNNTYSDDEDLYYRAVSMRKTDPQDVYDYVARWISFQERYNEVLPTIPIYSNIYFDFYTTQLQNYYITGHVTWSQAILEAYFGKELIYDEGDK